MPTFEYLRITLALPEPSPLLTVAGYDHVVRPRREYLSKAFSERRDFLYGQKVVSFVPMDAPDGYVAGFFGHAVERLGKAGPDESYIPEVLRTNDAALFVLDLADDSQLAAMEHKTSVGSPRRILLEFLSWLRGLDGFGGYDPHVQYHSNPQTYWTAVEQHRGSITQIAFTFVPPNALKSKAKVMEFIAEASRDAHNDLLKHTYLSTSGKINPNAELLAGSAEVALQGGGEAVVKVGNKVVFSSSKSRLTADVSPDEMPSNPTESMLLPGFIQRAFNLLIAVKR